ncbi:MAG: sulfite exporter TauE/SafE family protein [Deltaproteobacteria bacterium]|nr:sulfite exporter TauE/SafE family protein [Deltaproteobacteria bacterium]MBW2417147.1 sulfite exporter TauE/SafE family protein [Deltaproteobacteria bacterium]
MDGGIVAILFLGFGLGLVHALDADHVMAVTALASLRPRFSQSLGFALRWGFGHSVTLLVLGGMALTLGVALPPSLTEIVENIVGAVMIGLGVWVATDLLRRRGHIHFHRHAGLLPHAHWHSHPRPLADSHTQVESHAQVEPHAEDRVGLHGHDHGAVMVGALHGAAGSAPLLALLPAVAQESALIGIAYLLTFGAGLVFAMLLFSGVLGGVVSRLAHTRNTGAIELLRGATSLGSVAVGVALLAGVY